MQIFGEALTEGHREALGEFCVGAGEALERPWEVLGNNLGRSSEGLAGVLEDPSKASEVSKEVFCKAFQGLRKALRKAFGRSWKGL